MQPMEPAQTCPYCQVGHSTAATVCPTCGATRRKSGGKWTSRREGTRNDIMASMFVVLALFVLVGVLAGFVLGAGGQRTPSRFATCSPSSPLYPQC